MAHKHLQSTIDQIATTGEITPEGRGLGGNFVFKMTSNSCTSSQFDLSYLKNSESTISGFSQHVPTINKLMKNAQFMVKMASSLPYDKEKDIEMDKFLSNFEGNLSKSKRIDK